MSSPQLLTSLSSEKLDQLAQLIENEKCALVLGPSALRTLLAQHLAAEMQQSAGIEIPEPDDLGAVCTTFIQQPENSRTMLEIKVRDFYKKHTAVPELLSKVATMPFRIVLTTAHDDLLQRAFLEEKKRSFRNNHYRFSQKQEDDYDQTPEGQTYIYQLFGRTLDKPDGSLALTRQDQLEYIDSVQGVGVETRMPTGLRNALQKCEALLFLGFDYEDWYLRVLFHIMKFPEKTKFIFGLPEGRSAQMTPATSDFFRQLFRFTFFQNDAIDLLSKLQQRIEGDQNTANNIGLQRKILFIHTIEDGAEKDKIDRYLAAVKKEFGLSSQSIYDGLPGMNKETATASMVDEATVIIPIVTPGFMADDNLLAVTERAFNRQSDQVCVAAVYSKLSDGVGDFFRNRAPVLPADTIPLGLMQEEAGLSMIAKILKDHISILR